MRATIAPHDFCDQFGFIRFQDTERRLFLPMSTFRRLLDDRDG
jgi:hypothetical protein